MRAWRVEDPGPIDTIGPVLVDKNLPQPSPGEIRVRVSVCGVCRTDLHLSEGDLRPRRFGVTPGHEIVGNVDSLGAGVSRFALGDRVGIAWLRGTCGACRFCRAGAENLCLAPKFTGWDADGGFAEFAIVDADFAYSLPDGFDDRTAAPLLCAGIIGYRALERAELPDGGKLGIYGFGASAHITAQIAMSRGASVHVMTRGEDARALAADFGAASTQGAFDEPPEKLDSAIVFAPAGELVPVALRALDRGGTVACAGIYMSEIPPIDYEHELFYEHTLRSVTANTRADGEALLSLAAQTPVRVETIPYSFDRVGEALNDLAHDRFAGAAVIDVGS